MKSDKSKADFDVSEFIEGQDNDDHYQVQGDLEIAGVMYSNKVAN